MGLITISVSTYMILYSHILYERLAPWLSIFEREVPHRELDSQLDEGINVDVLLIGLGRYGDAEDSEFIATLPLTRVQWAVSTARNRSINRLLLHGLRQQNYRGRVAIATHNQQDAQVFKQEGADLVLIPYTDAAREAASRIMSSPVLASQ